MTFQYTTTFVAIATIEFVQVVNFYRLLFEQDPKPYNPTIYAEFQLNGLRLGIFPPNAEHCQEFADSSGSGMSICIEVEDLDAAIHHLTQIGYPPAGEIIHASHGREIYVYDPSGNRLILHQSSLG